MAVAKERLTWLLRDLPPLTIFEGSRKGQGAVDQLLAQLIIPVEPVYQTVQPGNQHLGANALNAMHPTKKANHRRLRRAATQLNHPHRNGQPVDRHMQRRTNPQMPRRLMQQLFKLRVLGEVAMDLVLRVAHEALGRGEA